MRPVDSQWSQPEQNMCFSESCWIGSQPNTAVLWRRAMQRSQLAEVQLLVFAFAIKNGAADNVGPFPETPFSRTREHADRSSASVVTRSTTAPAGVCSLI